MMGFYDSPLGTYNSNYSNNSDYNLSQNQNYSNPFGNQINGSNTDRQAARQEFSAELQSTGHSLSDLKQVRQAAWQQAKSQGLSGQDAKAFVHQTVANQLNSWGITPTGQQANGRTADSTNSNNGSLNTSDISSILSQLSPSDLQSLQAAIQQQYGQSSTGTSLNVQG